MTLRVKSAALVVDGFGLGDVGRAIGPLRVEDPGAVSLAVAPRGAVRAVFAGIRPEGTANHLELIERLQATGYETRLGTAHGETTARRDTAIEVVAAAAELAASPEVAEVLLVCPREHVELIARRVRAGGKRLAIADHPRTGFARFARLADRLIEMPLSCWPLAIGRAE